MKVLIKTYGCQMNVRDSEAIAGMLTKNGYEITADESEADVMLFNTCSVREQAEQKAVGKIGFMKKLKKIKPNLIIGVLGCMAQSKGDELFKTVPHIDFVLGTGQLHLLCDLLEEVIKERRPASLTAESSDVLTGMSEHFYSEQDENPYSKFIAVTRGCNRFCSYCIVPYVRGREISRSIDDVLQEAQDLSEHGVKEITLLGQNVAAFGLNGNVNPPPENFSPFGDLLVELNKIEKLKRIRFTSPYVSYFNDRLIEAIASSPKVCNNIHLPLQSGSAKILTLMNRQYTPEMYLEKVQKLRAMVPDITFSTDIIVGFPGETEEDFEATRRMMEQVGYNNAFIFKYSPRKGTKAALMDDQLPQEVKEERNQILLDLLKTQVGAAMRGLIGTTQEILVEGISRSKDKLFGRTANNFVVNFTAKPGTCPGDFSRVKIIRKGGVTLIGEEL